MNEITVNESLLKDTADAIVMYVLLEDMKYRGIETRVSNAFIRELDEYVENRLKALISYARVIGE
jgi:hypothetical protein